MNILSFIFENKKIIKKILKYKDDENDNIDESFKAFASKYKNLKLVLKDELLKAIINNKEYITKEIYKSNVLSFEKIFNYENNIYITDTGPSLDQIFEWIEKNIDIYLNI